MEAGLEGGKNGTTETSWRAVVLTQVRRGDSLDKDDGGREGESWMDKK